jgi:hypothetical protein
MPFVPANRSAVASIPLLCIAVLASVWFSSPNGLGRPLDEARLPPGPARYCPGRPALTPAVPPREEARAASQVKRFGQC